MGTIFFEPKAGHGLMIIFMGTRGQNMLNQSYLRKSGTHGPHSHILSLSKGPDTGGSENYAMWFEACVLSLSTARSVRTVEKAES